MRSLPPPGYSVEAEGSGAAVFAELAHDHDRFPLSVARLMLIGLLMKVALAGAESGGLAHGSLARSVPRAEWSMPPARVVWTEPAARPGLRIAEVSLPSGPIGWVGIEGSVEVATEILAALVEGLKNSSVTPTKSWSNGSYSVMPRSLDPAGVA